MKVKNYVIQKGVTTREIDNFKGVIRDSLFDSRYSYSGLNNNFPDYLAQVVNSSPTGSACLKVKKQFVKGKDFNIKNLNRLRINKHDTFNTLHNLVSADLSVYHRVAILVKREIDEDGIIINTALKHLPVEWVRFSIPDNEGYIQTIKYNPFYNTGNELSGNRVQECEYNVYSFDEKEVNLNIKKHFIDNGKKEPYYEVYFYNQTNELNRTYSRPEWFISSENALITDKSTWKFHQRNLENNFFIGGILEVEGDPDEPILDSDGVIISTNSEDLNRTLIEKFSGDRSAGTIMTFWKKGGESPIKYTPIGANDSSEKLIELMKMCWNVIPTALGVNPLLAGIATAGKLGNTNEKMEAVKLQNDATSELRGVLEIIYTDLLLKYPAVEIDENGVKILEIDQFTIPPDFIWNSLTFGQKQIYLRNHFNDFVVDIQEDQVVVETNDTTDQINKIV